MASPVKLGIGSLDYGGLSLSIRECLILVVVYLAPEIVGLSIHAIS